MSDSQTNPLHTTTLTRKFRSRHLGFELQLYGMDRHYKLFTQRQLAVLSTYCSLVWEIRSESFEIPSLL